MKPIEAARVHALAWMAASEAGVDAGRAAALAALEPRSGATYVAILAPRKRP
jgi:hypothetical protein